MAAVPQGSLTNQFRTLTTNALNGLTAQCQTDLGGIQDLLSGVQQMRFFDGRAGSSDSSLTLSQVAPGNPSNRTIGAVVNGNPDASILNAVVIPGNPNNAANDAVLISGNFFNKIASSQRAILVEETMHAVRGLTDAGLEAIAKKYGYGDFFDFIVGGCVTKK